MRPLKINAQATIIKRMFLIPVIAIFLGIVGISYISSMTMKEGMLDEMRSNGVYIATHIVDRIEDNHIMRSLISLIHALNLKVVIEGVEEFHELVTLKKDGTDYLQGYLFSRPMPADEIVKIFQKNYFKL